MYNLVEPCLDLALQLTALNLGAGVALEVANVLDGHLDDLRLLNSAPTFLQVRAGHEPAEVRQTVVHAVSPSLLYYSV